MDRISLKNLPNLKLNKFEAIIVASKHARSLNNKRIQILERMEENPDLNIDPRKITMVALSDLLEGRLKYTRSDSM